MELIDRLIGECAVATHKKPLALFPEAFFHLGGDEVSTGCWESTPRIAHWLKQQGMSADDAMQKYIDKVEALLKSHK